MSSSSNSYRKHSSMTRVNSQENEWNSFDQSMESLLGGCLAPSNGPTDQSSRQRTASSSGLAPSPSSLHSDIIPQQFSHENPEPGVIPGYPPMTDQQQLAMADPMATAEGMFSCAACGHKKSSYTEISKHVQEIGRAHV